MYELFFILLWMIILLIVGCVLEKIESKYSDFRIFCFIGIVIHELCHLIMCKIVGVRTRGIILKYAVGKERSPGGAVVIDNTDQICFGQAFLIAFAPLIFSTWLFFLTLELWLNPSIFSIIRIFAFIIWVSLLLKSNPSLIDLKQVTHSFANSPVKSIYQIILTVLSFVIIFFLISYYKITLKYDFVYYIIVYLCYYALKYGLKYAHRLVCMPFRSKANNKLKAQIDALKSSKSKVKNRTRKNHIQW